jgi:hypothetical protein
MGAYSHKKGDLGEMLRGDSADMLAGKFPLVSMGGQAEGLAGAAPEERGPPSALVEIGPSGVRALPLAAGINEGGHYFLVILVRAECMRCPWLLADTKVATILGIFFLVRAVCVCCPWFFLIS